MNNNLGFRYAMHGADSLRTLGDLEQRRDWQQYEWDQQEEELSNQAVGALVGNTISMGLGAYQKHRKQEDQTKKRGQKYSDDPLKGRAQVAYQKPLTEDADWTNQLVLAIQQMPTRFFQS